MGVSLDYIVKRESKLSEQEKAVISEIIEKYQIKDMEEMDWRGENIEIPNYDEYTAPVIFMGGIEIGNYEEDYEREIEEVVRWCYCLTEIAEHISNATWNVRLGDELLLFDSEIGFHLRKLPRSLHMELKPTV